jgi:hypothetical protein
MRRYIVLVAAAIAFQVFCSLTDAHAQDEEIPCDAFAKKSDGSWTATRATFINGPNFSVRLGGVFRRGDKYTDYDLAAKLDEVCRDAPPPAAMAPAATPAQQPRLALSQFADANGNLDVQRLTCGHIAEASTEEFELLLAWYSGADSGPAKRRVINMPRVRTASRNTADYCKANRDVALVKAMQLFLK